MGGQYDTLADVLEKAFVTTPTLDNKAVVITVKRQMNIYSLK